MDLRRDIGRRRLERSMQAYIDCSFIVGIANLEMNNMRTKFREIQGRLIIVVVGP